MHFCLVLAVEHLQGRNWAKNVTSVCTCEISGNLVIELHGIRTKPLTTDFPACLFVCVGRWTCAISNEVFEEEYNL